MNIKRIIAIILALALAMSLTACGNNDDSNTNSESNNSSETEVSTGFVNMYEDINISDYVKLGDYKNIEVTVDNSPINEDDLDRLIKQDLISYATSTLTLTEGVAQMDDYATIDYAGYIDGETFSGGSAKNQTIEIGSNEMIEGFEDALIGKPIGEEFDVNLTFPEDYGFDDLNGKDVVFKVTITKVTRYTYPELTDEFVSGTFGYNTVNEYKSAALEHLEETRISEIEQATKEAVYQEILKNSTIISLPDEMCSYYANAMYGQYEMMATYNGATDLEDYLSENLGMTTEELVEYCGMYADNYVTKDLIMLAILEAENIEITDEMYTQMIEAYATVAGYSDVESFEQDQTNTALSTNVIIDVAIEAAMETAKINYTSAATSDTDTSSDAAASDDASASDSDADADADSSESSDAE